MFREALIKSAFSWENIGDEAGKRATLHKRPYCRRGWAFTFCKDKQCSIVVPDEIREILLADLKNEDLQSVLVFTMGLRFALHACMNLFGVTGRNALLQIAHGNFLKNCYGCIYTEIDHIRIAET